MAFSDENPWHSDREYEALLALHALDAGTPIETIAAYFDASVDDVYAMVDAARDDIESTMKLMRDMR